MRMKNMDTAKDYRERKRKHWIWKRIVTGLACAVVFSTTYMLILPALTMEQTTYCGLEEHQHDESCYERQLICGLEETVPAEPDATEPEVSEEPEEEQPEQESAEPEEPEQAYDEEDDTEEETEQEEPVVEEPVEEEPEPSEPESPAQEQPAGHVHTDDCYATVLICQKEEHEHTLECFSDPSADVETREDWEKTMSDVELTGVLSDDVIAIAKTQIGYTESTGNYQVTEEGQEKGWTRYGAWYGDAYGDWNSYFTDFCLYYAGVPESQIPYGEDCKNWISSLKEREIYHSVNEEYTPEEGDLVFLDQDQDGTADTVGILSKYDEEIWVIAGDIENQVKELKLSANDSSISGYGAIPDKNDESIDNTSNVADFADEGISVTANTDFTYDFTADWDGTQIKDLSVIVSYKDKCTYIVEYSDDGTAWTEIKRESVTTNNQTLTIELSSGLPELSSKNINRTFRIRVLNEKGEKELAQSPAVTLISLLDKEKSGFSEWLKDTYVQEYEGKEPETVQDLYDAFALYKDLKTVTIATETQENDLHAKATVDVDGDYIYVWKYLDEDENWQSLTEDTSADINLSKIEVLLNGAKTIRCNIYQTTESGEKTLCGTSNELSVNPKRDEYDAAIAEINQELNLGDLAINDSLFKDYFYYGAVAEDDRVPFNNSEEYADYLAKLYIEKGIDKVKEAWDYYLYDLYDPDFVKKQENSGDQILYWPKASNDSFHANTNPEVKNLNYDFLENDVDYSSFITELGKTATADAAGDSNTERKYDIDITADVQAKVKAPVAMVLQIQTSWQMFDLTHANALKSDGSTSVGACANNTELGTLYDIKHALMRFADYMEKELPGNNLVLGITETRHATTDSVFNGKDSSGKTLYVTNDPEAIRNGLIGWDIFGNCEHVHYGSTALENAVANLSSNLSGWKDMYNQVINYEDIQKVAVIIGGPTENNSDEMGYGCTLPWSTFQTSNLNSVYAIRTNRGTSLNEHGVISWLDWSGNKGNTSFNDGNGDTYTKEYVSTNEDAIFNTLVQIAKTEMSKKGFDLNAEDKYVDNVTVTDTIQKEFLLDETKPITATIYNKDGSVMEERHLEKKDLSIKENTDGTTTISYNFGTVYNKKKCVLHFGIIAKDDYIGSNNVYTNQGTPGLTYTHDKIDSAGNTTGVTESYEVDSTDTPQVNVPIRYDVVDGDHITIPVDTTIDLKTLGEEIPKEVQDLLDNYPQINGTLSYVWVMPDGTRKTIGDVTVKKGVPGTFPDISEDFTPTEGGTYTGKLELTFTPEKVDADNSNFSDEKTKTAVNPVTKSGNITIDVRDPKVPYNILVRKVWNNTAESSQVPVTFKLLANGEETDKTYTLNKDNQWQLLIKDLPSMKEENEEWIPITYTVEETVPDGFQVVYSSDTKIDDTYAARATFVLCLTEKKDKAVIIKITCMTSDDTTYVKEYTVSGIDKDNDYTFIMENLPLKDDGTPLPVTSYQFELKDKDNKTIEVKTDKINTWSCTQESYISGTTSTPVLIMTNTPDGYELPKTGGPGTNLFTFGGLCLIAGTLMYGYHARRRRGKGVK